MGQKVTVTGVVQDEFGPLLGVTIQVKEEPTCGTIFHTRYGRSLHDPSR